MPKTRAKKAIQAVVSGDGVHGSGVTGDDTSHPEGSLPLRSKLPGVCTGSWCWALAKATEA